MTDTTAGRVSDAAVLNLISAVAELFQVLAAPVVKHGTVETDDGEQSIITSGHRGP